MSGSSSKTADSSSPIVILPNLGRRFSGVTSTLLQVLPHQLERIPLVVWGAAHVRDKSSVVGFRRLLALTKAPLPNGAWRVFHARRNIEMLWGLILKHGFRRRLKLVFTSTAQREHSRYTRFLYGRMDALITTSERAGSFLKRPADRIVAHGIQLDSFPYVEDKAKAWRDLGLPGKKGIGIFGRVRPQKGIDLFVDAMIKELPKHPDFTAVIVGKTTPMFEFFVKKCKARIRAAGLDDRFVWTGEVDFDRLLALHGAMSIVAAVSRVEGFGLTCLEAMSSGAPVIASQTGAFDLVVRDGIDGRVIPCGDSSRLADAFSELAGDPQRLKAMARSARERIESAFTVEREANELMEAYRKLSES